MSDWPHGAADSPDEAATVAPDPPKLIRGARAKLRLAGGSLLVLVLGGLFSPGAVPQPAPEEKVAPILEAALHEREPARLFRGAQEAGRAALPYAVAFPEPPRPDTHADFGSAVVAEPRPAAFGALLADGEVLTHVAALGGRTEPAVVLADGRETSARVRAYEAGTGLLLLQLGEPIGGPGAPIAAKPPSPGALAVAAARFEESEMVVPVFVGTVGPRSYTLTAAGSLLPPGTPVYNLAGEVLAVAAGQPSLAYPVAGALGRLRSVAQQGRGLPHTIGVCLQTVTPAMAELVGPGGVLVSDLHEAGPAERAGLRPGDVLLRVAGGPTPTVESARRQIASAAPGQPAELTVRRRGKEFAFDVRVEETLALDPCNEPRPAPGGAPRADRGLSAAQLAAAGLSQGALVLAVDGAPVTERDLASAMRRPRAARLMQVQEGTRRFIAVVGSGK